jgi:hypothetical protein
MKKHRKRIAYSEKLAARICRSIAQGKSLRKTLKAPGMPSKGVVMDWLQARQDFADAYRQARVRGIEHHVDEIIDLADSANQDNAAAVRLKVDTRKWLASKLAPKMYGDRTILEPDLPPVMPAEHDILDVARSIGWTLAAASAKVAEQAPGTPRMLPAPSVDDPSTRIVDEPSTKRDPPTPEAIEAAAERARQLDEEAEAARAERLFEGEIKREIRRQGGQLPERANGSGIGFHPATLGRRRPWGRG